MPSLPEISESLVFTPRWTDAPTRPRFERGEIHLWRARLDDPWLLALAADFLSVAETVRGARCMSKRERKRHHALHALLRIVLARYTGARPRELRFTRDERGKRALALSTLRFNLSHSEDLALLAVSGAGEIGVEIEQVRDDLPFDDIAEHFFEPEEQWQLRITHDRAKKASQFFDVWTTNEATLQTSDAYSTSPRVHRFSPAEGFAAAVAVSNCDARFAFWDWR